MSRITKADGPAQLLKALEQVFEAVATVHAHRVPQHAVVPHRRAPEQQAIWSDTSNRAKNKIAGRIIAWIDLVLARFLGNAGNEVSR